MGIESQPTLPGLEENKPVSRVMSSMSFRAYPKEIDPEKAEAEADRMTDLGVDNLHGALHRVGLGVVPKDILPVAGRRRLKPSSRGSVRDFSDGGRSDEYRDSGSPFTPETEESIKNSLAKLRVGVYAGLVERLNKQLDLGEISEPEYQAHIRKFLDKHNMS